MELKDKTVLISGASSGIGKSFAYLLASKGANVVLVARTKRKLDEIATAIQNNKKVKVNVITKDLSLPNSAEELYDEIKAKNIDIDILINNAGFGKWGRFEDFSKAEYQQMIQLNITSLTELCHCFIDYLKLKSESGIINVGSTASFMPIPFSAVDYLVIL
jgi:short-subunit dehydrogenase